MPSSVPAANSDPYLWVGPSSGRWGDSGNWQDQTTSDPGSYPGLHNAVQFGVDNPSQQTLANDTVAGMGQSASLLLYGNLTLDGTFRTGALDMALFYTPSQAYYTSASLTVTGAGNSLRASSVRAAGNLTVNDGGTVAVVAGYDIQSGRPGGNAPDYQLDGIRVDGAGSKVMIGGTLTTDNASDLLVTDGGYLQARRMTLDNTYGVAGYQVDAQSTIEVGTAGNAAAGTWTVDAGSILTIEKSVRLSAPEFVVDGWINDVGGLDLTGSPGDVTGSGQIRLEGNALLTIGQSSDQLSVVFTGNNAELNLADGTAGFDSMVRRFATGDSILVSGLTFDSATWQRNTLSLFDGGSVVGSLKMAGQYAGDAFSVSNDTITLDAGSSSTSAAARGRESAMASRPSSPATSSPAGNSDPYLWVGPSSGKWRDGANWEDQTTSATGSFPTAQNAVTFGVDNPNQQTQANVTVTGDGGSASLLLWGNLTLAGTFRTGALDMALFYKPQGDTYLASTVTVTGAGHSLTAGSAHAVGNLAVSDGATATVRGNYDLASGKPSVNDPLYFNYAIRVDGAGSKVTIGGLLSTDNSSDLIASDGGYLEARRMTLDNTLGVGAYAVNDAQSTIEVGTAGNAAAGTWTVDAGSILTIDNRVQLSAPEFVVNGWIDVAGDLDLSGSPGDVTGSGRIRIGAGASATVGQASGQLSAVFTGANSDLYLADGAPTFTATIRQFAAGDTIDVAGSTFDSATWQRNMLSLFNGTTLVGTLKLAGAYTGDTFSVSNNTITLNTGQSASGATDREAGGPRSLHLFTQAMASFERQTPALHEGLAAETQHTAHPMLAAAR